MLRQATQTSLPPFIRDCPMRTNCKARVIPYRTKNGYSKPFAKQNGFTNLRWYTDDGYSGANFQRPGFQAMLADIEAGKVGTVIVKDMSRLGRNYLQVGFYTEMLFPQKGVRFIAVNDNVVILSRLVDTFISKISLTMLPVPKPHNTACVLSWEEARHWQSRSSGYSSS